MANNNTILVIEPAEQLSLMIQDLNTTLNLQGDQHLHVVQISKGQRAIEWFGSGDDRTVAVFIDTSIDDMSALDVLKQLSAHNFFVNIVIVSDHVSLDDAVQHGRYGSAANLMKPVNPEQVRQLVLSFTSGFDYLRRLKQWRRWDNVISSKVSLANTLFHDALLHFMLNDEGYPYDRVKTLFPRLHQNELIPPEELVNLINTSLGEIISYPDSGTLLMIEDEEDLLFFAGKILSQRYNVLKARNGEEALAQLRENPQIDVILLDIYLPDIKGTELYPQLRSINPSAEVIVTTAYQEATVAEQLFRDGVFDYTNKPYEQDVLFAKIDQAIRYKHCLALLPVLAEKLKNKLLSREVRLAKLDEFCKRKLAKNKHLSMAELVTFFPECDLVHLPSIPNFTPPTMETGLAEFIGGLMSLSRDSVQMETRHLQRLRGLYQF